MLILRDYILSAASEINAGGGNNGDNPTNLGVSDFSLVAATLDTNNRSIRVVLKSSLIDSEAPMGNEAQASSGSVSLFAA
jgi:hypothetical protein